MPEYRGQGEDRFLAPGTRVGMAWDNEDGTNDLEVGVIVHCWMSSEIDAHDCYIAFFGREFPDGQPREIPYIYRYAATSLVEIID